jgi:hypothetical protein
MVLTMNSTPAFQALVQALQIGLDEALAVGINSGPLSEALRLAEESAAEVNAQSGPRAEAALASLRLSAAQLRKAVVVTTRRSENEALEHARRTMTTAFAALDDIRQAQRAKR